MVRLVASPPMLYFPISQEVGQGLSPTHTHTHTPFSQILWVVTSALKSPKGIFAVRSSIFKTQMTHHWPGSPQSYNLSGCQEEGQGGQKAKTEVTSPSSSEAHKTHHKAVTISTKLSTIRGCVKHEPCPYVWITPPWVLTFSPPGSYPNPLRVLHACLPGTSGRRPLLCKGEDPALVQHKHTLIAEDIHTNWTSTGMHFLYFPWNKHSFQSIRESKVFFWNSGEWWGKKK